MKPYLLTALTVLTLAAAGPSFAANEAHDHGHGTMSGTLQLNAGKKWETDTPLRKSMGEIRQSMASSLHAIHENKLTSKSYGTLAKKVEGVKEVHHVHIWAISTTENALTAHLVLDQNITSEEEQKIKHDLKHRFLHLNIHHATLETERENVICETEDC